MQNWVPSQLCSAGEAGKQLWFKKKKCHEIPYHFECGFFLFGHLLSCCGFLTCFQNSCKVILVSLWLCLQCFCSEIKAWSFLSTWFLICNLGYCIKNLTTSHLHSLLYAWFSTYMFSSGQKKHFSQAQQSLNILLCMINSNCQRLYSFH